MGCHILSLFQHKGTHLAARVNDNPGLLAPGQMVVSHPVVAKVKQTGVPIRNGVDGLDGKGCAPTSSRIEHNVKGMFGDLPQPASRVWKFVVCRVSVAVLKRSLLIRIQVVSVEEASTV